MLVCQQSALLKSQGSSVALVVLEVRADERGVAAAAAPIEDGDLAPLAFASIRIRWALFCLEKAVFPKGLLSCHFFGVYAWTASFSHWVPSLARTAPQVPTWKMSSSLYWQSPTKLKKESLEMAQRALSVVQGLLAFS